jgi:hypothetical protein
MGKRSLGEIVANGLIITMVVLGTAFFVNLPEATQGEGLMAKLIITIQVIPALVLLAAMIKGVAKAARREPEQSAAAETAPEAE